MRFLALAFVLASVGCGGKKPDCGAYAAKFADNSGADPSRRTTVLAGAQDACENGLVDQKQVDCVMAATKPEDVRACVAPK